MCDVIKEGKAISDGKTHVALAISDGGAHVAPVLQVVGG